MTRLSLATFDRLPTHVRRFSYDRAALKTGVVHLGIGAFSRAHLLDYTDEILSKEFGPWGVCGVSMRRPDVVETLRPQDGLYTIAVRGAEGEKRVAIGALNALAVLPEDPRGLIARMASADTRIVSLTVTEKGYCHDPATGRLNAAHPDIAHDLEHRETPRSAIGTIVAALAARRKAGLGPFTVMPLDNLPSNGEVVRGLTLAYAALVDDALAQWIENNGAFPSTMVDRIVPATTDADIAATAQALGLEDRAVVTTESFRQWVIEDEFANGRPAWEKVGAEIVSDVAPFEFMKLRMLNGAHSSLAYLGYLSGHETVAEASGDPVLAQFLEGLWREIIPTVPPPSGADLPAYAKALLDRFRNPSIRHRTWQIAMDGSQKLPQRLLGTIRERLKSGAPIAHLATGVAAWMRYVMGVDENGKAIEVRDPLADKLRAAADAAGRDAGRLSAALLRFDTIFGSDLPENATFRAAVQSALARILQDGARAAAKAA
ncbi:mannitol dehydrogenase family protein [Terrarubrum flagellatum]|uniref:mannitol dehydrogenase family protein n=1 Tax=Terrirubrum flagellatum TaxID=2895980 RepID=UPI003144F853